MADRVGVVAFSGGLDTSFLVPFAREKHKLDEVVTVTVNTGGFSEADLETIAARSKEVGAERHISIDGESHFYDSVIKYLIFGNVNRDGYPLCVGAERFTQAVKVLDVCAKSDASVFMHGSTGAGNDQYRFDVVAYALGGENLEVVAPIRELGLSREEETEFLRKRGIAVPQKNSDYSYNVGLWGVSVGGKETHSSTSEVPLSAWHSQPSDSAKETWITLDFVKGEIEALRIGDTKITGAVNSLKELARVGNSLGIGRHYHIGTSIPGKKGRLAYESPAADIVYEAHRTLEKITLTQLQISGKRMVADEFGRLIHEAKFLDPYLEDLKAFLQHSQERVTGSVRVCLAPGYVRVALADSPYNLMKSKTALYGETSSFYGGEEAKGAVKLHALEQVIYRGIGR